MTTPIRDLVTKTNATSHAKLSLQSPIRVYAIPFLIRPGKVLQAYNPTTMAQIVHGESTKGRGGPHGTRACPPLRPWRPCRRVLVNVYNSIGLPVDSSDKIFQQQSPDKIAPVMALPLVGAPPLLQYFSCFLAVLIS